MASNRIQSLNTATLDSPNGQVVAIMIALDIPEAGQLDNFMNLVVEKFKAHRMCSPPETAALLVTITGNVSAGDFARRWAALAFKDQILRHFMAEMQLADVLLGTAAGEVKEMVSLRDSVK